VKLQDLNSLDFNDIGDWPTPIKLLLILLVATLVGVAWYYMDTKDQYVALERVRREEKDLRANFEEKQQKAANYEKYKAQLAEMKQTFGAMLRQLPNKKEVADLLIDVSQTGLAAGLEFQLFQPQNEIPKDFYAELPIKLRVVGDYHEFGEFISGIAALPRIVTMHDIDIKPITGQRAGGLVMEATAATYRYLDEGGALADAGAAPGAGQPAGGGNK
jgi:type IV pilus assembly protein PilO